MDRYEKSADLLHGAKRITVLTGAGMSTESGLKDFRSKSGLSSSLYEGYAPEEILSRSFFRRNTDLFYSYLREHLDVTGITPNIGHKILAQWQGRKPHHIITQNIDSLHQAAGSHDVLEIHGTLTTATCTGCKKQKSLREVLDRGYSCDCGGVYKPDIVLYDEEVSQIYEAFRLAEESDLLVVLGTSLKVYPAASIPEAYGIRKKPAIIINRDPSPYAFGYNVVEINESIGETLRRIDEILKKKHPLEEMPR
ncbi:NAD-dependent deacylase [Proteiniclasticum sp. BAD-10]|uniref:protein acetyllysine N-acetyltransferase n=1 Tax=Proteiniclasticum sediminis TaxID=2804028 RepID=A0A941CQS2_9CLOT|nr:NAD-dependent deacylase [Proteiniclasticum sediminis]MBR0575601.1 NAD-dependent deacylase [Proteiniclasticum sediminis]